MTKALWSFGGSASRLRRRPSGSVLALLAGLAAAAGHCQTNAETAPEPREVELRGRVICLQEELHRTYDLELPANHAHLFVFKAADGACYTLVRTRMSEALFLDERLRQRELVIRGRVFPGTQALEVLGNLHSVRDGKLFDVYYYCEICAIKAVSPEPCMCCHQPVELVEKPL